MLTDPRFRRLYLSLLLICIQLFTVARLSAQVAAPQFQPSSATSVIPFAVVVTCSTPGASIYYTTDGSTPNPPANGTLLSGSSISIGRNLTLSAVAQLDGTSSAVSTGNFLVTGEIDGGALHAAALKSNGTIYTWGLQTNGRLGNGLLASGSCSTPQQVLKVTETGTVPFTDAIDASAGYAHTLAVDSAGYAYGFGSNYPCGEVGMGSVSPTQSAVAVHVRSSSVTTGTDNYLANITQVSAGFQMSLALSSTNDVWAWGDQSYGKLGDGRGQGAQPYAVHVLTGTANLTGILQVAAGLDGGLARDFNGNVWSWGKNTYGEVGVGDIAHHTTAVKVQLSSTDGLLQNVVDVSAGINLSTAVCESGSQNTAVP